MTTQTLTLTLPNRLSWQNRVVREARRFNTVCIGRRAGKTTLGIDRCATKETLPHPVGWFSPSYRMMLEVWRTVERILQPITTRKSVQDHRLEFVTGGILEFWSLDNPDVARGRKYRRVIVDEAAMVPALMDAWNYVLRPTLTDFGGDAWFLSTPKGRNGFWQMYNWGVDPEIADWACWQMPSYVNDKIDRSEFDAMRDTLPEMAYRQEILAEFLENQGSVFRNISACMNAPTTTPAQHAGHTIVAGLDLAKQNDFTVISIGCRDCRMEIARDRFNQVDYLFQVGRIKAICERWGVQSLLVDSTGVGSPVLEQLQNDGLPAAGFVFTATTKPPLIENLSLALERAEWQFQPDPVWTLELEAYERTVSPTTGRSSYSAPDGSNDDTVIGRALMVWQARNSISMFDIL
jgi:hypothetical protein